MANIHEFENMLNEVLSDLRERGLVELHDFICDGIWGDTPNPVVIPMVEELYDNLIASVMGATIVYERKLVDDENGEPINDGFSIMTLEEVTGFQEETKTRVIGQNISDKDRKARNAAAMAILQGLRR